MFIYLSCKSSSTVVRHVKVSVLNKSDPRESKQTGEQFNFIPKIKTKINSAFIDKVLNGRFDQPSKQISSPILSIKVNFFINIFLSTEGLTGKKRGFLVSLSLKSRRCFQKNKNPLY